MFRQRTQLTTVDENADLEAYIYIPTERSGDVKPGLGIDILDNSGHLVEHTTIDFVSPRWITSSKAFWRRRKFTAYPTYYAMRSW